MYRTAHKNAAARVMVEEGDCEVMLLSIIEELIRRETAREGSYSGSRCRQRMVEMEQLNRFLRREIADRELAKEALRASKRDATIWPSYCLRSSHRSDIGASPPDACEESSPSPRLRTSCACLTWSLPPLGEYANRSRSGRAWFSS